MAEREKPKVKDLHDDRGTESAEYIAELTNELAKLARRSRLDLLAYLLDIASLEARSEAERARTPISEHQGNGAISAVQG